MDLSKYNHFKTQTYSLRAYLSGGMENAKDEGSNWRIKITNWLKENLKHDVIDPVLESEKKVIELDAENYREWKNSNPEKFKKFIRILINQDLRSVIEKADYLIVLWDKSVIYGGGTHGEITMAYWANKPVYLVNRLPSDKLSAWILSCSTEMFESFDNLKKQLLTTYQK